MTPESPQKVLFKTAIWNGLLYLTWPIWLPFALLREGGRAVRKLVRRFLRAGDSHDKR